jgi:hypothetical protein
MRLTLRTLLAYLDDTLDANEIKEIGEKVAESDAAQELVARLKQVTRRRRLTAPPATGPEGTDPNDVAEYLDNELAAERVSDLEKMALESDVHLAEIAACHQILTLVLGEPALVPPKSKERMYALVRGREALPHRKAHAPKHPDKEATVDEEELNLSSGWLRWVLPAAGILLVGLLALAVYSVLPGGPRQKGTTVASGDGKAPVVNGGAPDAKDDGKGKRAGDGGAPPTGGGTEGGAGGTGTEKKDGPGSGKVEDGAAEVRRPAAPSKERMLVANYLGAPSGLPAGLATLPEGGDKWQRFGTSGATVFSSDPVLALPGFAGVVRTKSGVDVTLRGHLRDFTIAPVMHFLMDSAVVFHASKEFDLDLTLLRGRIFITSRKDKGAAKVRLRFDKEVWDLTLAGRGDEVAVDLTRAYSAVINYRAGEEPRAQCFLALLRGEADLKIDAFQTHSLEAEPPKWVRMEWDSFTRTAGPFKVDQATPALRREPPPPELLPEARRESLRRMETALKNLEALLGSGKSLEVALQETLQKPDPAGRVLAVYCLTAIDAIGPVIDVLGDEDPQHVADREAAFFALQRWVGRSPKQAKRLYDEKTKTGLLIDKKYRQREAETIVQLLHPLLADEMTKAETYEALARCLQHRKVAIAEMGYWHLVWLSGNVKLPQGFNAALPQEDRERYSAQVQKLIDDKRLPPAGPAAPEKEKGSGG